MSEEGSTLDVLYVGIGASHQSLPPNSTSATTGRLRLLFTNLHLGRVKGKVGRRGVSIKISSIIQFRPNKREINKQSTDFLFTLTSDGGMA